MRATQRSLPSEDLFSSLAYAVESGGFGGFGDSIHKLALTIDNSGYGDRGRATYPDFDAWVAAGAALKVRSDRDYLIEKTMESHSGIGLKYVADDGCAVNETKWSERMSAFAESVGSRVFAATFEGTKPHGSKSDIDNIEKAKNLVAEYIRCPIASLKRKLSMTITGTFGAGKDHLLSIAAKEFCRHGFSVLHTSGTSLFSSLRRATAKQGDSEHDIVRRMVSPNVLWISDPAIAGSPLTPFQGEVFHEIIDQRWVAEQKVTWISLNAANDVDASAMLGGAIWSRLNHGLRIHMALSSDYRQVDPMTSEYECFAVAVKRYIRSARPQRVADEVRAQLEAALAEFAPCEAFDSN